MYAIAICHGTKRNKIFFIARKKEEILVLSAENELFNPLDHISVEYVFHLFFCDHKVEKEREQTSKLFAMAEPSHIVHNFTELTKVGASNGWFLFFFYRNKEKYTIFPISNLTKSHTN